MIERGFHLCNQYPVFSECFIKMYSDLNNDLYNTPLLRTYKLANSLQTRSQLEEFVEHILTHADQNVQIIVEEERKSLDED